MAIAVIGLIRIRLSIDFLLIFYFILTLPRSFAVER